MEIKSRVKKYEQVRDGIQQTKEESNSIQSVFRNEENINNEQSYEPTRQKKTTTEIDYSVEDNTSFKNEYLDSFIQEVKEYNIQKGNRYHEDTKLDILEQLNAQNRDKRKRYIEKEEIVYNNSDYVLPDDNKASNEEISQQIFSLLDSSDEVFEDTNVPPVPDKEVITVVDQQLVDRINQLETQLEQTVDFTQEILKQKEELENLSNKPNEDLLEQTTQMQIEMDKQKVDLTDLNKEVDSNNRLLNVIITIQVLALLGIIGAVVYWLVSGGII